jgi:hypothetical protein
MIVNGPNLTDSNNSQVSLIVGQTIVHNVKKRKPNSLMKVGTLLTENLHYQFTLT